MKNHLFIGLGGQGGKTIAELKKVFSSREQDANHLDDLGQTCDFLYIDSSRDVTDERRNWFHFGKDLSLKPDSFLYLKDGGESIDVDSMAQKPDVAPWIGEKDKLKRFLEGSQGIQGANQRRRLGRLLFARNATRIRQAVCEDKIGPMLANANQCAIHIFASLAGGTGSGCLVDLVSMIRTAFPNAAATGGFPIFLYLYVTSKDFTAAKVGCFHENQAATLRDLNALACGRFKPTLFASAKRDARFSGDEPIAQIILSSHLSNRNQQLSLTQQHQILAEAAFERIYSYVSGSLDTTFQKSLTGEDVLAAFGGEPAGDLMRSFRFGSVGMRRWEVPIDEIRELLAKDLYACCYRQLLFQNWSPNRGAVGEKLPSDIPGFSQALSEVTALIDSESVARNESERLIEKLDADFNRYHAGRVRQGFKDLDLSGYESELQKRFDDELDGRGVSEVFRDIASGREQRIERLQSGMQSIIETAWKRSQPRLGLAYIDDLLLKAQESIRKRLRDSTEGPKNNELIRLRMEKRKREWAKMTALSRPLLQDKLALAHQSDLAELLHTNIKIRAKEEDRMLYDSVAQKLGMLAADYQLAASRVTEWCSAAQKRRDELLLALKALKEKDSSAKEEVVANKAEFSLETLDAHLKDQNLEDTYISNTCDDLVQNAFTVALGNSKLAKLGRISDEQTNYFRESADNIVYRKVLEIHNSIRERTHRDSILSGNVLDIVEQRYREDPDRFTKELKQFIDSATCNISIKTSELQPSEIKGDTGMPPMPRAGLLIGLPKNHTFGTELQRMFTPLLPAGSTEGKGIYFHDDPTQIRLLFVYYWMAARFANVVHELEAMYRDSLDQDDAGDIRYFTNLDDSGEKGSRPSLLLPSAMESHSLLRAALWVGTRIACPNGAGPLIQDSENGAMLIEHKEGRVVPRRLGASIDALKSAADFPTICRVGDAVAAEVCLLSDERIQELKTALTEDDVKKLGDFGPGSSEFLKWTDDRERIHELLKR
jgi:hemerythrin-like domain-containing protein